MVPESSCVLLVHGPEPSPQLLAAQRMAEFLGASCVRQYWHDGQPSLVEGGAACVVVDASSLGADAITEGRGLPEDALGGVRIPVLLLVTEPGPSEALLSRWTEGIVAVEERRDAATRLHFPRSSAPFTRELASTTFSREGPTPLRLVTAQQVTTLMTVGDGATFVAWKAVASEWYAWSTPSVMDVSAVVGQELDFERALDTCLPLVIFLRRALGETCWHNPERLAGFVIDDPLLVRRYGFIDFAALLQSARDRCYHVSLAFIPWNGWRTRYGPSRIFREFADVFSLCVHGCDHNNNEYGQADYGLLRDKSLRALDRMDRLSQRVGIPYAPLAVCPQEQCSEEGWKAFADTPGILGMVNTGCLARNVRNERVTFGDLLLPAQDAIFGFPVFKRYYPGDFSAFALALFLGKPAILVEHHEYFRDGLAAIEAFVSRLREQCPDVRWLRLQETATLTHLRRTVSTDCRAVRFFTNQFELHPNVDGPMRWVLHKRVAAQPIASVRVDGVPHPFRVTGEFLEFDLHTTSSDRRVIAVEPVLDRRPSQPSSLTTHARVAARRAFSEFRDNVLARHPHALSLARGVTRSLGLAARRQAS